MSNTPDNDLNLDLHFLPKWAQQSPDINRYSHFTGEEGANERRFRRGDRGPDRGGPQAPGSRPPRSGPRPEGRRPDGPRPEGARREGGGFARPHGGASGGRPGGGRRDDFRGRGPDRRNEPILPPPLELNATILPDEKGIESLARQIKMSGRAYPLFEIAHMILKRPERHTVLLSTKKKDDGTAAQPLFTCALDDSLWLSEAEAVKHGLDNYFDTFYKTEKVPVDPPKGVYTFVAQCGMSGVVLGPPNHHDYQNQLRRLHAERFSRMPFDAFKSRVKIVREETVVKKWVEDQSSKAEYHCLNVDEPLKLDSREEVEKHFREVHVPNLIRQVDTVKVSFEATKKLRHPGLLRTVRMAYEGQRRFPLQVATHLSQQFASRGLQFFKVNKTVTHVAVARPSYLDLETNVVSDGVKKIVEFINSNAKCTRRQLFEALMPSALQLTVNPATPPGTASADSATPESPSPETAPAAKPQITPEIQTFMTDLHWLIHQGHVLEFANGVMETAKKPMPRPTKAPAEKPAGKSEPKAEANVETAADQVPSEASLAAEASPAPQDAGEQPLGAS